MKVFNLIYTKVAPDESPWREKDFHTVFYPINLLQREDVFELEKRIHFPSAERFSKKETVFYHKIQGEYYLVILHIRSLPDERDTFGRGGIFLCHGFLFPPELWKNVPTPLTLFEIAKDSLFTNRECILSSPLVDRKTGNISPIEVSKEKLECFSKRLPHLPSEADWEMVMILNRIASSSEQKPIVILKGKPDNISAQINKWVAYVPDGLKINLGWDPAFEEGNLFFFPLKIVGFEGRCPNIGNAINIDVDVESFHIKKSLDSSSLLMPTSPYENWLNHCRKEATSKEQIEKAYNLSLILKGKIDQIRGDVLTERSCFVSANQGLIKDEFLKRCSETVGQVIAQHIANELDVKPMLDLIIENLPPVKLTGITENIIINKRLVLKTFKTPLPDSLINVGSHRLKLVARVWKGDTLKHEDLVALKEEEKAQFIKYLLLTEWSDKEWVTELLKEEGGILEQLLSLYDTREAIKKILLRVISKEKKFQGIERLLLDRVIGQKREVDLIQGKVDFLEVLEGFLRGGLWSLGDKDIEDVLSWSKKQKPPRGEYPCIRAFLYPEEGIPSDLLENEVTRKKLVECLIELHGYKVKDIERLGIILKAKEVLQIEEKIKDKSVIGRIKGLFGLTTSNKR